MKSYLDKLACREEFFRRSAELRAAGRRVAFTNGCFDLLHAGHVRYLARGRGLADALFVGVNTDASVRRLKGPSRPLVEERERAEVLAALEMVDCVTLFDEPTPLELVLGTRPDVLFKGGDWTKEMIVGAPEVEGWGGRVAVIPLEEGLGTSVLIERILARHGAVPGEGRP
ncbi:MAG: D-glycero-beta-D-manno-heptose 1-phosphate adenylyltransferase [Candidatus Riflebacteria bacterium]|nr:D-glycero-beta-D-manno-heptose 1-phosphate adenylyltransferase [Candidatus Riflebacteria bacterium]